MVWRPPHPVQGAGECARVARKHLLQGERGDLAPLLRRQPESRIVFAREGLFPQLLSPLRMHGTDAGLCISACKAIYNLALERIYAAELVREVCGTGCSTVSPHPSGWRQRVAHGPTEVPPREPDLRHPHPVPHLAVLPKHRPSTGVFSACGLGPTLVRLTRAGDRQRRCAGLPTPLARPCSVHAGSSLAGGDFANAGTLAPLHPTADCARHRDRRPARALCRRRIISGSPHGRGQADARCRFTASCCSNSLPSR